MSVKRYGSSVFQYCNTFYLLNGKAIDRTLYTVNKNQNVFFTSSLDATDIKGRSTVFLTLETGILVGIRPRIFPYKASAKLMAEVRRSSSAVMVVAAAVVRNSDCSTP